jgi:hypothetical protein
MGGRDATCGPRANVRGSVRVSARRQPTPSPPHALACLLQQLLPRGPPLRPGPVYSLRPKKKHATFDFWISCLTIRLIQFFDENIIYFLITYVIIIYILIKTYLF